MEQKSWKEFQNNGLLLFINQILHVFGWAIVMEQDKKTGEITKVYPARVKWRGFDGDSVSKAYKKLNKYLMDNSKELYDEVDNLSPEKGTEPVEAKKQPKKEEKKPIQIKAPPIQCQIYETIGGKFAIRRETGEVWTGKGHEDWVSLDSGEHIWENRNKGLAEHLAGFLEGELKKKQK